jgi:hypothetical protein
MPWQISTDRATWTDFATAGITDCLLRFVSCGTDTATLQVDGDYLASPLAAYGATLYLRDAAGVQRFIGRVNALPRMATGQAESYQVEMVGAWWWLERVSAQQAWASGGDYARLIVGQDDAGARVRLSQTIQAAVQRAIDRGVPLALGDIAEMGYVPAFEISNQRCSDVVLSCLRWFPDYLLAWDYSGEVPELSIIAPDDVSATSVDLVAHPPVDVQLAPRYADVCVGVRVIYEIARTVSGVVTNGYVYDTAGNATSPLALEVVFPLRGRSSRNAVVERLEQAIETQLIETSSKAFWREIFYGTLGAVPDEDWTLEEVIPISTSTRAHRLVSGSYAEWMHTYHNVTVSEDEWAIEVEITRRDDADNIVSTSRRRLAAKWIAINSTTRTLTHERTEAVVDDDGEAVPTGVALQLYRSWSRLHFDGRISWDADEVAFFSLGSRLRLTNGRAEWATMDSSIRQIEYAVASGRTTLLPGPPARLEAEAAIALARAARGFRRPDAPRNASSAPTVWPTQGPSLTSAQHTVSEGDEGASSRKVLVAVGAAGKIIDLDPEAIEGAESGESAGEATIKPRQCWECVPTFDSETGELTNLRFQIREMLASDAVNTPADVTVIDCADEGAG